MAKWVVEAAETAATSRTSRKDENNDVLGDQHAVAVLLVYVDGDLAGQLAGLLVSVGLSVGGDEHVGDVLDEHFVVAELLVGLGLGVDRVGGHQNALPPEASSTMTRPSVALDHGEDGDASYLL